MKRAKKMQGIACPACGMNELNEDVARNALSRFVVDTQICNKCGVREAVSQFFWRGRAIENPTIRRNIKAGWA